MLNELADYPQLFTVEEVAKIFRLTRAVIRRMIRDKEMVAVKIGKEYRIPQHVVQNILQPLTQENLMAAGFGLWKNQKLPEASVWLRKKRKRDGRDISQYLQNLQAK